MCVPELLRCIILSFLFLFMKTFSLDSLLFFFFFPFRFSVEDKKMWVSDIKKCLFDVGFIFLFCGEKNRLGMKKAMCTVLWKKE